MTSLAETKRANFARLKEMGFTVSEALELQALARSLNRIDENSCNYDYSEKEQERIDRREALRESRAYVIAKSQGYKVYRQTDPRGWSLYLYKDSDLDHFEGRYKIDSVYSSIAFGVCSQ